MRLHNAADSIQIRTFFITGTFKSFLAANVTLGTRFDLDFFVYFPGARHDGHLPHLGEGPSGLLHDPGGPLPEGALPQLGARRRRPKLDARAAQQPGARRKWSMIYK